MSNYLWHVNKTKYIKMIKMKVVSLWNLRFTEISISDALSYNKTRYKVLVISDHFKLVDTDYSKWYHNLLPVNCKLLYCSIFLMYKRNNSLQMNNRRIKNSKCGHYPFKSTQNFTKLFVYFHHEKINMIFFSQFFKVKNHINKYLWSVSHKYKYIK